MGVRVGPGWHAAAGGWGRRRIPAGGMIVRRVLPPTVHIRHYAQPVRGPIVGGIGQEVVAGGTATVRLGPAGYGVAWYPVAADIATTTGANDTSTCTLYLGAIAAATQLAPTSYAGGGDTLGLSGRAIQPGEFIIAVWSGATNGDTVTLRLTGDQTALVPAAELG